MDNTFGITYKEKDVEIAIYPTGEHISDEIRRRGSFYEIEFLQYIESNYSVQKGIVDIGANIGNHSLFFSEFLQYDRIYAFEPSSDNFKILESNLIDKKADVFQIALSDKKGEMTLYNSEMGNSGGFSLHPQPKSFVVKDKIDVRTLDSYKLNNVTMMKVDVEGAEESVLKGSLDTIKRNRPIIFVENLGWAWPELFEVDRLDSFFNTIEYSRKESNIPGEMGGHGSLMDLWIPNETIIK
jgi:FkbM family methyltransferase